MICTLTDKNKEALENYTELWDEIKDQIELINRNEPIEYEKKIMKIRFESDDDLTLGKMLNIPACVIIARCFSSFSCFSSFIHKYYPQVSTFMSMNIKMKMIFIPLYK